MSASPGTDNMPDSDTRTARAPASFGGNCGHPGSACFPQCSQQRSPTDAQCGVLQLRESSWRHWTSIIIEDLFKDHASVLPTVGLVKKIDFFINNIPFDLKVTYFPEQLLADKLHDNGYGNELTMLKKVCRVLRIFIPNDLNPKELKLHLFNKLREDQRREAKNFVIELNDAKKEIMDESENNPAELKKWFYENQGEARFDASNRFFLVLTDESDMSSSWKLKRNIVFLQEKIHRHLDNLAMDIDSLNTEFYWAQDQRSYSCKSDILFLKYSGAA